MDARKVRIDGTLYEIEIDKKSKEGGELNRQINIYKISKGLAMVMDAAFLVFAIQVFRHTLHTRGEGWGWFLVIVVGVLSGSPNIAGGLISHFLGLLVFLQIFYRARKGDLRSCWRSTNKKQKAPITGQFLLFGV